MIGLAFISGLYYLAFVSRILCRAYVILALEGLTRTHTPEFEIPNLILNPEGASKQYVIYLLFLFFPASEVAMDMRKVRVFPEDKLLAFQSPANNEVESPPLLERCRRSTIRRETHHSITSTYKPPPPWQVKLIIFIIAIVAFLVWVRPKATGYLTFCLFFFSLLCFLLGCLLLPSFFCSSVLFYVFFSFFFSLFLCSSFYFLSLLFSICTKGLFS